MASLLGLDLMPWQRQVVEVATEYDPETGAPFYGEVFVTTPRQSGKSSLILALLLDRCLAWGRPQACVWTGQDLQSIATKWRYEFVPHIERSELAPMLKSARYANGSQAFEFHGGSRISLLSTSESAGHGMVLDMCVLDEVFSDKDNRREAALAPTMITRPDAQMLLCSTAGDAGAVFYNRKVEVGRKAVRDDPGSGVAYFEWSAPDDWDPEDEASWWGFMPALGHTITPAAIRARLQSEERDVFTRAYGNRPQLDESEVIPDRAWRLVVSDSVAVKTPVRIGVDVGPDRDVAAIAVADLYGVELVKYEQGSLEWVVPDLTAMASRLGCPVLYDGTGPASGLAGIEQVPGVRAMKSPDVGAACSAFYDSIGDGSIRVRQALALDVAVKGLVRRQMGDRFVWSRRSSRRDVTPLYAATFAWAGVAEPVRQVPPAAMYVGFS